MQKLFSLLLALTLCSCKNLYRLNISTSDITVSGISGGAFFAVQFGVAYSSLIKGVARFIKFVIFYYILIVLQVDRITVLLII